MGPLEVVDDERLVPLGGVRQRALLAILLLRANQVVSTDHLIEKLWGASPPPTARQPVQVYVSQLRRVLPVEGAPEARTIETPAPGYWLHVGPGQRDLDRFEELVTAGRAALGSGDVEGAARILREALALGGARRSPISPTRSSPSARSPGWRSGVSSPRGSGSSAIERRFT